MSVNQRGDKAADSKITSTALLGLVRAMAAEAGLTRPLTDADAFAVLAHFDCPEEDYRPLPEDWDSPEFLAEIERREKLPHEPMSPQTVKTFLTEYWGNGRSENPA